MQHDSLHVPPRGHEGQEPVSPALLLLFAGLCGIRKELTCADTLRVGVGSRLLARSPPLGSCYSLSSSESLWFFPTTVGPGPSQGANPSKSTNFTEKTKDGRVGSQGVERCRRSLDQIEGPGDQKLTLLVASSKRFSPCASVSPPVQ